MGVFFIYLVNLFLSFGVFFKVTFKDPEAAMRACQNPSPVIDGRRANCNLASLGANKTRPPAPHQGISIYCFLFFHDHIFDQFVFNANVNNPFKILCTKMNHGSWYIFDSPFRKFLFNIFIMFLCLFQHLEASRFRSLQFG